MFDVEHKPVRKHGVTQTFHHIHIRDRYPVELTIYPADKAHYVFKSSITGKAIERASLAELEAFLRREYPDLDLDEAVHDKSPRRSIGFRSTNRCCCLWKTSNKVASITPKGMSCTTACRSLNSPATNCPTTRSFCWRRCCMTSAKALIRMTTCRRDWRPWRASSRRAPLG